MSFEPPESLGLWSWQRDLALDDLRHYRDAVVDRIIPAFRDMEAEAIAHGEAKFQLHTTSEPVVEGRDAQYAEVAHEAAVLKFGALQQVLRVTVNFAAATLFHSSWETPVREWLRRETAFAASRAELAKIEGVKLEDVAAFLKRHSWDISKASWYDDLAELRLVANTVKHARGKAANTLFGTRRSLFYPFNRMEPDEFISSYEPDGADLVIEVEDFERYAAALERFWIEAPAGNEY